MKRILIVFGTRPEAIKMASLAILMAKHTDRFQTRIAVSAQHREMLDQVLDFFSLKPDYDLNLMKNNQSLNQLTADIVTGMKIVLEDFNPHYVFVHGDTTTSTMAALAAFYYGSKICHVEAGLRTYNKQSPFPEEVNRQLTTRLADYHFAPTVQARENLISEGVAKQSIIVTGNTVIDALLYTSKKVKVYQDIEIQKLKTILQNRHPIVLVTGHRRENLGEGFKRVCKALKIVAKNNNVQIVYPVHPNPLVRDQVREELDNLENIQLIEPLSYSSFIWLMGKCKFIITDSGGVQEEAPSLGKPVLLTRETTERPEAVAAGTVLMVGTDVESIVAEATRLLHDKKWYLQMSQRSNPYGNGDSSEIIVKALLSFL